MIEHISLTARDIDAMTEFLLVVFEDYRVRGEGVGEHAGRPQRWRHVGNDSQYIALYEAMPGATDRPAAHTFAPSANHIGVVVEDAESLRKRLLAAGYREGFVPKPHPHRRRVYIIDPEGLDWEFVQYFSDDPKERNEY